MTSEGPPAGPLPPLTPRFRLGEVLGEGGFGVVRAASDSERPGFEAAVKLSKAPPDAETLGRIEREAEAAAQLDHPGLARFVGVFGHGDGVALVYARVPGRPLDRLVPVAPSALGDLVGPLAEAVDALHAAGLIHRDIKPANVLVRPDGAPVLLDFGLLRATQAGSTVTREGWILGTPGFMAPELFLGEAATPASDRFALAALAYHLLRGQPPFGATPAEVTAAYAAGPRALDAVVAELPDSLATAFRSGLAFPPEDRPASAGEFARALGEGNRTLARGSEAETVLRALPAPVAAVPTTRAAPPPPRPSTARPSGPGRPALVGLGRSAFVGLGLLGLVLAAWRAARPAAPAAPVVRPAEAEVEEAEVPAWLPPLLVEVRTVGGLGIDAEQRILSADVAAVDPEARSLVSADPGMWPRLAGSMPLLRRFLAEQLPVVSPAMNRDPYDRLDKALGTLGLPPAVAPLFDAPAGGGPLPTAPPSRFGGLFASETLLWLYRRLPERDAMTQRVFRELAALATLVEEFDRLRRERPGELPADFRRLSGLFGFRAETSTFPRFLELNSRTGHNRAVLARWVAPLRVRARGFYLATRMAVASQVTEYRVLAWVGVTLLAAFEDLIGPDLAFLGAEAYLGVRPEAPLDPWLASLVGHLQVLEDNYRRNYSAISARPGGPAALYQTLATDEDPGSDGWRVDIAAEALFRSAAQRADPAMFERTLAWTRQGLPPAHRAQTRLLWLALGEYLIETGAFAAMRPAEVRHILEIARHPPPAGDPAMEPFLRRHATVERKLAPLARAAGVLVAEDP